MGVLPNGFSSGWIQTGELLCQDLHSERLAHQHRTLGVMDPVWMGLLPMGSCAATTKGDKARWTTDMIQFAVERSLPVQENLYPTQPGKQLPFVSIAAILQLFAAQKKARLEGASNWRELELDDSKDMMAQSVHVT